VNVLAWNLVGCCKIPKNTCSATSRRFVSDNWQKSGLSDKKTKLLGFSPVWSPKTNFNFCDNHRKGKVLTDIFYLESLVPTILIWALRFFEWKQLFFLGNVKTGFSPKTTSPVRITYAKKFIAVFRIRRCVHGLSNSIHSRVREWEKWTYTKCFSQWTCLNNISWNIENAENETCGWYKKDFFQECFCLKNDCEFFEILAFYSVPRFVLLPHEKRVISCYIFVIIFLDCCCLNCYQQRFTFLQNQTCSPTYHKRKQESC